MKKVLLLISTLLLTVLLISCKTKVYTVTFNSDGGSSVEKQEVKKGDLATKPSNPTKDNYDFQVWVDEDNKEWIFATRKVEKDVTLKATWKEKTPVIEKFKLTLSEGLSSNQANNNEIAKGTAVTITVTVPADKQIKTFTVNGEDKKNSIGINNQFKFNIMANTTIVLVLEDKTTPVEKVTVEFILGFEGTAIPNQEINKGAKATKPTNPVREGYNFLGWTTVENGTALFNFDTAVNANQKLYAKWEIKTFVVTVDLKDGTTPTTQTVNWNETVTLETPTRAGYTFVKWVSNGTDFTAETPITAETLVEAVWEATEYTITYDLNEGTNHTENPLTYTLESNTIILQTPTKEGYIFNGWYEGETKVTQIETTRLENIVLEARWTEKEPGVTYYEVVFDSQEGTPVSTQEVKEGKTATKPINPTKEGYIFVEWQLNDVEYDFATPVNSTLTLVAKWEINTFEVTIDLDYEGAEPTTQTINWKGTVTLTEPTRESHDFIGWFVGDEPFDVNTLITEEFTITARWEIKTFEVTVDLNNGSGAEIQVINWGERPTLLGKDDVTKDGYIFYHWYVGDTRDNDNLLVKSELTFKLKWAKEAATAEGLKEALKPENLEAGVPILITAPIVLDEPLTLPAGALLDGGGQTISFGPQTQAPVRFIGSSMILSSLRLNAEIETGLLIESDGSQLVNTTIKGATGYGVTVKNAKNVLIEDIEIVNSGKGAILVTGSVVTIKDVTMTNNVKNIIVESGTGTPLVTTEGFLTTNNSEALIVVEQDVQSIEDWFITNLFAIRKENETRIQFVSELNETLGQAYTLNNGINYIVQDYKTLLNDTNVDNITLLESITLTEQLVIRRELTLDGNNKTLTLNNTDGWNAEYVIQVYNAVGVVIKNITLKGGDAALLVNASEVEVENIVLDTHEFGGIELAKGENPKNNPTLVVNGLTYTNINESLPVIWVDELASNEYEVSGHQLKEYNHPTKNQVWYVVESYDTDAPEVEVKTIVNKDGTIVITIEANDENLYSLEIDHNFEGLLPEFTVYASEGNPYGTDEQKAIFVTYGVTVIFAEGKWTITIDESSYKQLITSDKTEFVVYFVIADKNGNKFGSMSSTTAENTIKVTLEEVGVENEEELRLAITNPKVKVINLVNDIELATSLLVTRPVTINGNGNTLSLPISTTWVEGNYVIQAFKATGVVIKNITLAGGNAGLLVNGSEVEVEEVIVKDNSFGGIEVSKGKNVTTKAILTVNGLTYVTTNNLPVIWVDKLTSGEYEVNVEGLLPYKPVGKDQVWYVEASRVPMTVEENIEAALNYKYTDREYVGTFELNGTETLATYSGVVAAKSIMDDLARYLGALYRVDGSVVREITFNGVKYTWNESKGLKGSNWFNGDVTLVSAVSQQFLLNPNKLSYEFELSDGENKETLTLKVAESTKVSVNVENELEIRVALGNSRVVEINLTENINLATSLLVTRPVLINGNGNTLSLPTSTTWTAGNYVIQVYNTTDVVIKNITLAGGNAGLLVNGSEVEVEDAKVTNNSFGGIEVSKGTNSSLEAPSLVVKGTVTFDKANLPVIWVDGIDANWVESNLVATIYTKANGDKQVWFGPEAYVFETVYVTTEEELREAVANPKVKVINLVNDIELLQSLLVTRPVEINGNNKELSLPTNTTWVEGNYVIQAFKTTDVVIKNITLVGGNAGLLVNGSEVEVENVIVKDNSFGGVEVSKGKNVTSTPRLTVNGLTYLTTNNLPVIWVDGIEADWVESNLTATTYTKENGDKQVWFGSETYVFETVYVTTKEELVSAVANQNVKVINILNDILLTVTEYNRTNAGLLINRPVKVNGNGYTLSLATQATWQNPGHYVIHVYNTTGVLLENVKLAGGNVGLLVNGAGVSVDRVAVSGNEFGGIEIAQGSVAPKAPKLTVLGTVTFDKTNLPIIWVDGTNENWVESNLVATIYTKANRDKQVWFGPETYVFETVYVTTEEELRLAVDNQAVKVINILNDIILSETSDRVKSGLVISRPVEINGNGNALTMESAAGWQGNYIIQVIRTENVKLSNIKFNGADAAILVNGAVVEVEDIVLGNHEFGGVEVSQGETSNLLTPKLTVSGLEVEGLLATLPRIWVDGTEASWVNYTGSVATTYTKENGDKQIWFGPEAYVFKTVNVTTADELIAAVENTVVEVINLVNNIELIPGTYSTTKAGLLITRPLTINGNGKELSITSDAGWQANYIIQIFGTDGVILENINFNGGDAALLVNGSEVKLENITLVNQEFGGIEVKVLRAKEPKLTINELKYDSKVLPTVWFDGIATEIKLDKLTKIELVAANGKDQVWFVNSDFVQTKAYVRNEEELRAALTKVSIKEIILINDIDLVKGIVIERAIILNGNDKQFTFKNLDNTEVANYLRHGVIVGLNVSNVVIKNITIDGYKDGYGILVHGGVNVLIQGVTVKNSSKGGIQVNGSKVIVEDLTLKNNEWGGIQVVAFENHTPELELRGDISNNQSTKPVIWLETENGAGWVIQDSEILTIFNGHGKKQIWYINDTFDLELPVFISKEMKNDEASIVLIIEATDENLYSLEIDHNLEGKLPEFTVYASKENPYGTEEQRDAFESYNVSVEYENGKWIIIFSGKTYETILKEHNGNFVVYFVIGDTNGNKFGSMSPTTSENTIILSLEEVQLKTEEELRLAVANPKVKVINILNDIVLDETSDRVKSGLVISRPLTINGNGKVLSMKSEDGWKGNYIIQVIRTENVKLSNIKFNGGDAAILVNGAVVEVADIVLGNHEFGGIEVSKGETSGLLEPKLTVNRLTASNLESTLPTIWIDGKHTNDGWVENIQPLSEVQYVKEDGTRQLLFVDSKIVASVTTAEELRTAVSDSTKMIIILSNDIVLNSNLDIKRSLILNGNNKTIKFENVEIENKHGIIISSNNVIITELTVDGYGKGYGIQAYNKEGIILDKVTVKNSSKGGILVNNAVVIVKDVILENNAWGGIEVSKGQTGTLEPKLTVLGNITYIIGNSGKTAIIWIDGKTTNNDWVIQNDLKETIQGNQLWFESSIAVIDVLDVRTQSNLPRLHLGFKLTSDFDLDNLNNDIKVAYYTIVNGEKIPVKNNGLDLIKNKNWAGFLLNGSTKYVKGLKGASDYAEANSNLLTKDLLFATQLRNGQSSDGSNMEYHDIDWNSSYTFYVEVRLVSGNVTTIASSTYTY